MPHGTGQRSLSLDGFAGPDQTRDAPGGQGGMALHGRHLDPDEPGRETAPRVRDTPLCA
jgi:hypothetical protein